jgi:hypothetical protein
VGAAVDGGVLGLSAARGSKSDSAGADADAADAGDAADAAEALDAADAADAAGDPRTGGAPLSVDDIESVDGKSIDGGADDSSGVESDAELSSFADSEDEDEDDDDAADYREEPEIP